MRCLTNWTELLDRQVKVIFKSGAAATIQFQGMSKAKKKLYGKMDDDTVSWDLSSVDSLIVL